MSSRYQSCWKHAGLEVKTSQSKPGLFLTWKVETSRPMRIGSGCTENVCFRAFTAGGAFKLSLLAARSQDQWPSKPCVPAAHAALDVCGLFSTWYSSVGPLFQGLYALLPAALLSPGYDAHSLLPLYFVLLGRGVVLLRLRWGLWEASGDTGFIVAVCDGLLLLWPSSPCHSCRMLCLLGWIRNRHHSESSQIIQLWGSS